MGSDPCEANKDGVMYCIRVVLLDTSFILYFLTEIEWILLSTLQVLDNQSIRIYTYACYIYIITLFIKDNQQK